MEKAVVVTTINHITKGVDKFASFDGWDTILIGDKKTPNIRSRGRSNLHFLSLEDQKEKGWALSHLLPENHYARKNLGYLTALEAGAKKIADTDDDNIPYDSWREQMHVENRKVRVIKSPVFPNVYSLFTDHHVWPRGYPLDRILDGQEVSLTDEVLSNSDIGVVQGLADLEPDVDAIYRLVLGKEITFNDHPPVALDAFVYSPFNSQNTLWHADVAALMYLPSTVTFRFTDILRSYVAQRGLWAIGKNVVFTGASVKQERNPHNLMADFQSEIPCYRDIDKVVETLNTLTLSGNPEVDLITMYEALEGKEIVDREEITLIDAWLDDLQEVK